LNKFGNYTKENTEVAVSVTCTIETVQKSEKNMTSA